MAATAADLRERALAALRDGRSDEAQAILHAAVALAPASGEVQASLASAHIAAGRFAEALAALDRALRLGQDGVALRLNRAGVLLRLERPAAAVDDYDAVLALQPDHPVALARRPQAARAAVPALQRQAAEVLEQGLAAAAEACFHRILVLCPDLPSSHNNLGIVLLQQGRLAEAAECFRAALRLQPDYPEVASNLLFCQHYDETVDDAGLQAAHLAWDRSFGPAVAAPAPRRGPRERLRLGLVSPNFNRHAVGWFLAGVLEHIDRERFAVVGYDDGSPADSVNARLRGGAELWREVGGDNDDALAARIAEDGIDILFDLAGHTSHNRLRLFARRAAPLQVSWLGWFNTTGLRAMDAVVMDPWTVPPGGERWFSEQVIRLPHTRFCYWPPPEAPEPVLPPLLRGVPFTFGSFNNLSKLNPAVIALWAAVLRAVPDSRLVLKWKSLADAQVRCRLAEAFAAEGVAPSRLEFRPKTVHRAMLAEYGDIDLALDPFPFTGGLTSCEALWMGVPVLTLPGRRPVSRQTYAFLANLGLAEDFAAADAADYVAKAAAWSTRAADLATLRRTLRPRMAASPLCDGRAMALALEEALLALWRG